MTALKSMSRVMNNPTAYRLWQAPFVGAKFEPIVRHNDLDKVRRVLDVGCGPGTNASWFAHVDYLGLDLNPDYIEMARRRYGRDFQVADVCTYEAQPDAKFDFILLNSLLHHIDEEHVYRILRQLSKQLTPDGCVHIIDLVLPEKRCMARTLALGDRGDWPRPLAHWREIFEACFEPVVWEPFELRMCGASLWQMAYFKGKARS